MLGVKAELIALAVKKDQYPAEGPPEIAFAGRSNVGKSSLLNLLTGRKKLAHVSGTPGKTQTINFFSIMNDELRIVDLPGYGYARLPKSVTAKWGRMIETYLEGRGTLKRVVLLVDSRHKPTQQDIELYEYLRFHGLSGVVVATKADKLNASERVRGEKLIRSTLGLGTDDRLAFFSAFKDTERYQSELWDLINVSIASS